LLGRAASNPVKNSQREEKNLPEHYASPFQTTNTEIKASSAADGGIPEGSGGDGEGGGNPVLRLRGDTRARTTTTQKKLQHVKQREQVEEDTNEQRLETSLSLPIVKEEALLKRMGWKPPGATYDSKQSTTSTLGLASGDSSYLSESEIKSWKSKWSGWNSAKRATIRRVIGLPPNAGLGEVIQKLVQLENEP